MSRIKKFFQIIFDGRFLWIIRYLIYKLINRNIKGFGYFGKPLFVSGFHNIKIEDDFGIFPGARLEIDSGKLIIKSGVRIGHNILIDSTSRIIIDENVVISANVYIGTTKYNIPNDRSGFKEWKSEGKDIMIGRNVFIGYGAVILPGTVLGDACVVGANSVVSGYYEKGSVISSHTTKVIRCRVE